MQTMAFTAGDLPAPAVDLDVLLLGAKAGPWIVERELGRGGMGSVYAVVHEEIGKRAALKVMHHRLSVGKSAERILLEARVVNQVGHPNIVDIFETGTLADGRPYIVMERLDGVPLAVHAGERKILTDQVIAILLQVCDALIAAHAAGIVHRDLKPDNIFLIDNPDDPEVGRIKVLDWGIAKVMASDPHHTIEGQLVGTPHYLAPEQARGGAVSPATDVYSLGVMAYQLFVEELPFQAETAAEVMAMHLRAAPPPPSELWPDMPRELEDLLLAMLAKAPEDRPSVLAVTRVLEAVRAELASRCKVTTGTLEPRATSKHDAQATRGAAGLASTALAIAHRRKRWQFVVVAVAIFASATMYMLARDLDGAAAPPLSAAFVSAEPITAQLDIGVHPPAYELTTVVPAVEPEGSPNPAVGRGAHDSEHPSRQVASPKHPAKPRRDIAYDPDGTIDPY
jgi:tRNA A-37 threonylcarbamoyl transferase component Bud32